MAQANALFSWSRIMSSIDLPMPIAAYVRSYVARQRRFALLRAGGLAIAAALAWMLLACLLDRWLQLPPLARLILLATDAALLAILLARPLQQALRAEIDLPAATADIERQNPAFSQRLQTVVSQLLEKDAYRGSQDMLQKLLEEVADDARRDHPRRWAYWRITLPPWLAAGLIFGGMIGLSQMPEMGMLTLARRFAQPLAAIAPVTTTLLSIDAAEQQLVRGATLTIRARVARLSGPAPEIFTSYDQTAWSRLVMLPVSENEYVFTLPAIDRDLWYYVRGGDATTPIYKITVLRPPAVSEFRLRYEYPSYMQRPPVTLSNVDGVIDALVGTKVSLALIATEPLEKALLQLGDQRLPMSPTADPNVWQAELLISRSLVAELRMTSRGQQSSRIAAALTIRAQPDRLPVAQLLQPTDDLRVPESELLDVRYQAADDFGIARLALIAQVNAHSALELPIRRHGDVRLQEGQAWLDLSSLKVKVGDVVSLTLQAQDGAGRKVHSAARQVLVAPRSIDSNTRLAIAELKQARRSAQSVGEELEAAGKSLATARRSAPSPTGEYLTHRLQTSRNLTAALEAALTLHQALLRASARSHQPRLAEALAEVVDRARVLAWACEQLTTIDAHDSQEQKLSEKLPPAFQDARHLAMEIKTLAEGEQAAAILADRQTLRALEGVMPKDRAAAKRLREMLQRSQEALAAELRDLGLSGSTAQLDQRLREKAQTAQRLIRSRWSVDYEPMAQIWAEAVSKNEEPFPPLPERLLSGAMVEAMRQDGSPTAARDFQVASRAASRLAELWASAGGGGTEELRQALADLPGVIALLQRAQIASRSERAPHEVEEMRLAAQEARGKLAQWAGQTELAQSPTRHELMEAEDLALQASAEMARRNYTPAETLDQRLTRQAALPEATAEQIRRSVAAAQAIDQALAEQNQLRAQTASVDGVQHVQVLARQQRQLVERIASIEGSSPEVLAAGESEAAPKLQASAEVTPDTQAAARLMEHRPLLAARWLAERAAQALEEQPPKLGPATRRQDEALAALQRAWDDALRQAATQRLALVRNFRPLLAMPAEEALVDRPLKPSLEFLPGLRPWELLQLPSGGPLALPPLESQAPAYLEPLRLYFQALGKAQGQK